MIGSQSEAIAGRRDKAFTLCSGLIDVITVGAQLIVFYIKEGTKLTPGHALDRQ